MPARVLGVGGTPLWQAKRDDDDSIGSDTTESDGDEGDDGELVRRALHSRSHVRDGGRVPT